MEKRIVEPMQDLTIVNNSDSTILYLFSNQNPDTYLFASFPFSDTAKWEINGKSQITLKGDDYTVNDFSGTAATRDRYLFLFSKKVLETEKWDTIREKNLILKRYVLSVTYLLNNNWTVTYP